MNQSALIACQHYRAKLRRPASPVYLPNQLPILKPSLIEMQLGTKTQCVSDTRLVMMSIPKRPAKRHHTAWK
ncbi:hypothetical protein AAKU55_001559 [Oxalobacteraceae bacterium GrIS 1.11]